MWLGAPSSTAEMRYQDRQYWIDSQVAGEGGVASFSANSFCNIKFPSGLTLGGIDFMNGYQAAETSAFGGSDVTMSGDAFVRTSHTGAGIRLGVALTGSAGDTLTTKGAGRLRLLKPNRRSWKAAILIAAFVFRGTIGLRLSPFW